MVFEHNPVMEKEVLQYLIQRNDGNYLDCTLGGGGHAEKILAEIAPKGFLIGLDQDIEALEHARIVLKPFAQRALIVKSNFCKVEKVLHDIGIDALSGILFDLGVSSYQFDRPERGFSFSKDNRLDMRMDLSQILDAQFVINHYSEDELWQIFSQFGEERFSKSIARLIVRERKKQSIKTTIELTQIIKRVYARLKKNKWRIHPATRVFQALRIEVNSELKKLQKSLKQSIKLLEHNGRICIISYHSLEDRIVKQTFKRFAHKESIKEKGWGLDIMTKKPLRPTQIELMENNRARSAKMRVAKKIMLEEVA